VTQELPSAASMTGLDGRQGDDGYSGGGAGEGLGDPPTDDYYYYNLGDGIAAIDDWGGYDILVFGAGIAPADVAVVRTIEDDVLFYLPDGGELRILFGIDPDHAVEEVRFDDGTVWSFAELIARSQGSTDGDDTLTGTLNDDTMLGLGGADLLFGFEGSDLLDGGSGDDLLVGGEDSDSLVGGSGDDLVEGGAGSDQLTGNAGDDTYLFQRGFGEDSVADSDSSGGGGFDRITFTDDIAPSEVTVSADGDTDLILSIAGSADSIRIVNALTDPAMTIEEVVFTDGTVWTFAELVARAQGATDGDDTLTGTLDDDTIRGLGGADLLFGFEGSDLLDGGSGDDLLVGGDDSDSVVGGEGDDLVEGGAGSDQLTGNAGNDTYLFQRGFGEDSVADSDSSGGGGFDRITFTDDIAPSEVTVSADGDTDLVLTIAGSTDSIRIVNVLTDPSRTIEEVVFTDGTVWTAWMLLAMAAPPPFVGTEADDSYTGTNIGESIDGGAGNDTLYGRGGMDTIRGGLGDDILSGGFGTDYYYYTPGDGNDVIIENGAPGDFAWDRLFIAEGLEVWDTTVALTDDGFSYILYFGAGEASITLYGAASGDPAYRVEMIHFRSSMLRGLTLGSYAQDVGNGDDVLNMLPYSDTLRGLGGNDILNGTANSDRLHGNAGDDILIAGDGVDLLYGGAGADLMNGGAGDDYYFVDDDGDAIVEAADEGFDQVYSTAATTELSDNVERLIGSSESGQTLIGSGGDNTIEARGGDDILEGRGGDDLLQGDAGFDIYRFARGDGHDMVVDWSAGNAVELADDILPADVRVTVSGSDFVLTVAGGGGSVTLASGAARTEGFEVRFDDGTVWTHADIAARSLIGGDDADVLTGDYGDNALLGMGGDDVLMGSFGNDSLDGGTGDDQLSGGYGDDTYLFERGFGLDSVFDPDSAGGDGFDRIAFTDDIAPSEVTVSTEGDTDLILSIAGTADSIRLVNALTDPTAKIEEVTFADGTVWTFAELIARTQGSTDGDDTLTGTLDPDTLLGLGGADLLFGFEGDDLLDGGSGDDLLVGGEDSDSLAGGAGDDLVEGGAGSDELTGNAGDDTYLFQRGFGADSVADSDSSGGGGFDRITFTDDIAPSEVTVAAFGDSDLLLSINGTGDSIRIVNVLTDPSRTIEEVVFTDGTVWTAWTLLAMAAPPPFVGTDGDDSYVGGNLRDIIDGRGGNDSLHGGGGADYLRGGLGDDILAGGGGADFYNLEPGDGHDVIIESTAPGDIPYWSDRIRVGGDREAWNTTVTLSEDGFSYILYFGDGEDSVTLYGAASGDPAYRIEMIDFRSSMLRGLTLGSSVVAGVSNGDDIRTGTDGGDSLRGLRGDDIIDGGAGGDLLKGDAGDDSLNGGEGSDHLDGGAGADVLTGGAHSDSYWVDDSNDVVVELEGGGDDDVVRSTAAAYVLPDHVERLEGYATGGQTLTGNGSDNSIQGWSGDDIIEGGAGDDNLAGGEGADVYRFARGDGDDSIWEWGPGNAIEFAPDILPDNVTASLSPSGNSITLRVDGIGGTIALSYDYNSNVELFEVRFANGIVWSNADILLRPFIGGSGADVLAGDWRNNELLGLAGDDVLDGGDGDDVLVGGAGADLLHGHQGNDIFRFERGFGEDVISSADAGQGGFDRIEFLGDILPGDVSVRSTHGGAILLVSIAGTADSIRLDVFQYYEPLVIDEVAFADGTVWSAAELLAMAVATPGPASEYSGTQGGDTLSGSGVDDSILGLGGDDSLFGGGGSDWLYGGLGDDLLVGGAGSDHYFFEPGDGNDVIRESDGPGAGGYDTVWVGGGLQPGDTTVTLSPDGLSYVLYFGGGEESLTLYGAASGEAKYQVEMIRFSQWMIFGSHLAASVVQVTNGDDVLIGDPYSNNARGLGGDDVMHGGTYRDWLKGDGGDDSLFGGDENDELDGGPGIDQLTGGAGDDVYLVDDSADLVIEADGEGEDEVRTTTVAYALPGHVEKLSGMSDLGQVLTGNALDNFIAGGTGDDVLTGGAGNDVLDGGWGGADIHRFARGDGDDVVREPWWESEQNAIEFASDILPANVTVIQSGWDIVLVVDQGGGSVTLVDQVRWSPVKEVTFGDGSSWGYAEILARSMIGTDQADVRIGTGQDDLLMGMGGDDQLDGDWGNDVLNGGDGNDILMGGWGSDQLTGGAGADVFLFRLHELNSSSAADRILDFVAGEDVIDVSGLDADWTTGWGVYEAFTFIGGAAFSGTAGELRFVFDGTNTRIQMDTYGNGYANTEIILSGNVVPLATDFVL
jgi:Ca2+-binding RTX toxin-like protein